MSGRKHLVDIHRGVCKSWQFYHDVLIKLQEHEVSKKHDASVPFFIRQ